MNETLQSYRANMQLALCCIISSLCFLYILTLEVFSYCVLVLCYLVGGLKSASKNWALTDFTSILLNWKFVSPELSYWLCTDLQGEDWRLLWFSLITTKPEEVSLLTRLLKAGSLALKKQLYSIRNVLITYVSV